MQEKQKSNRKPQVTYLLFLVNVYSGYLEYLMYVEFWVLNSVNVSFGMCLGSY